LYFVVVIELYFNYYTSTLIVGSRKSLSKPGYSCFVVLNLILVDLYLNK